jgi:hypothetical protein
MPPPHWEQALRDELDSLAHRAHRPARERVPLSAEAVLFDDSAELLACLASDLCNGVIGERWWWRSLYPDLDLRRVLLTAWLETPQLLPVAFDHLVHQNALFAFVRHLPEQETEALLHGLFTTFGPATVLSAFRSRLASHDVRRVPRSDAVPAPVYAHPPDELSDARVGWETTIESIPSSESVAPVPRAPWEAYVPELADAAALTLLQQALCGVGLALIRAPTVVRGPQFATALRAWLDSATPTAMRPSSTGSCVAMDTAPATAASVHRGQLPPIVTSRPTSAYSAGPRLTERLAGAEANPNPARNSEQAVRIAPPPEYVQDWPAAESSIAAEIHTSLGGIFYLVNVALALDLYGDFTQPLHEDIALPIWDFLTLVARRLARRQHPSDPIWRLLRDLAGRRNRVRPNVDVARLVVAARTYLLHVLSVNRRVHLGELLLERGARVCVTPVYLDIYLSLEELPISVRMAGLDRDPGWVPAAGRQIAFHFD